jgi:predicted negative regulator of RcsB-dependent stress response
MKIKPENRFWIWIYGFTAFIMLIAMSVFGWLAWTSRQEPGIGRVAGDRPQSTVSSIPDERLELLATFQAPAYVPDPAAPKGFPDAIRSYAAQDFAAAIPKLRAVTTASPGFRGTNLYLGICLLLTGDRISGIQELRAVADAKDPRYGPPARFYLAKGLIAEHDLTRAEAQLQALIAQHGDMEKQAGALLAQIRPSS